MLGLRGTGKTVLLNTFEKIAEDEHFLTALIEAPEDKALSSLLFPHLYRAVRRFSAVESSKHLAHEAMRALRSFASAFKVTVEGIEIAVEPAPGIADSGNLEMDLTDLFLQVGTLASAAGRGWALIVDEVQYLSEQELAALIVAIHRVNQRQLPIIVLAAGLPQLAKLAGDAKSYAERLFTFSSLGALDKQDAFDAIRLPIEAEGESISSEALEAIFEQTEGYPYFLQEWGAVAWNQANRSPISLSDIRQCTEQVKRQLDEGFFRIRMDRLTPAEIDYVRVMAAQGRGPYRTADVARAHSRTQAQLGPVRASVIAKGMAYAPKHGTVDFTVPMFDDFVRRTL